MSKLSHLGDLEHFELFKNLTKSRKMNMRAFQFFSFLILTLLFLSSCVVPEIGLGVSEKVQKSLKSKGGLNSDKISPSDDKDEEQEEEKIENEEQKREEEQNAEAPASEDLQDQSEGKDNTASDSSKYTAEDLLNCQGERAMNEEENALMSFSKKILGINNIDIHFEKSIIDLVEKDIKKYVKKHSKISVYDFWKALSKKTIRKLNVKLVISYNQLSEVDFNKRKQVLAYAFLYQIEKGAKEALFRFFFNDQNGSDANQRVISFKSTQDISKAEDVKICNDIKLSQISIETKLNNAKLRSRILCVNDGGTVIELVENDKKQLEIKIDSKIKRDLSLEVKNLQVHITQEEVSLSFREWNVWPEVDIEMLKRVENVPGWGGIDYVDGSVETMDLIIRNSYFKYDTFYDLQCREFKKHTFITD